jgi:hypothetical protein
VQTRGEHAEGKHPPNAHPTGVLTFTSQYLKGTQWVLDHGPYLASLVGKLVNPAPSRDSWTDLEVEETMKPGNRSLNHLPRYSQKERRPNCVVDRFMEICETNEVEVFRESFEGLVGVILSEWSALFIQKRLRADLWKQGRREYQYGRIFVCGWRVGGGVGGI